MKAFLALVFLILAVSSVYASSGSVSLQERPMTERESLHRIRVLQAIQVLLIFALLLSAFPPSHLQSMQEAGGVKAIFDSRFVCV